MTLPRWTSRSLAALLLALSVLVGIPTATAVASEGATALKACRPGQPPARACGLEVRVDITGQGTMTATGPGVTDFDCSAVTSCVTTVGFEQATMLTAVPAPGWRLVSFAGPGCTESPCMIVPTSNVVLTATFAPIQHRVSVRVEGEGLVTSDPGTIDCAGGVKHRGALPGETCTDLFDDGVALTLTASADDGYQFTGWSAAPPPRNGRRLPAAACSGTDWLCVVPAVHETIDLVATFERVHAVRVQVDGAGQVTSDPAGVLCTSSTPGRHKPKQSCSWDFLDGADVTLTATPDPGHVFVGWTDGITVRPAHRDPAPACTGTEPVCALDALSDDALVRAVFAPAPADDRHRLSVTTAGDGAGTVTSNPVGISCRRNTGGVQDCSQAYDNGTAVTLTAIPEPGSAFAGFTGGDCVGSTSCTVVMDGDRSARALFTPLQGALEVAVSGLGGGRVVSDPHGIDCGSSCSGEFDHGRVVTLRAEPDKRSALEGWTGCPSAEGPVCTVLVGEELSLVEASFRDVRAPRTTITRTPSTPNNDHSAFRFTSDEQGSSFECSMDGGARSACTSPVDYPCLAPGRHVFRVWAVDRSGNRDRTAAVRRFTVVGGNGC